MSKRRNHKQRHRRHRVQRALRILACVLFALPGLDLSAQRPGGILRTLPGPGTLNNHLRFRRVVPGPVSPATNDHPLFHSSYMGEPDRIVAHTRYGDVSARDLYLWLIMREGPHRAYLLESFDKAMTQSEKEQIALALRDEIDEYVFTNLIIPKIMGNAPCDGVAAVKEQLYTLPVYQLAYIKHVIEPTLAVLPADRVKYLREHQAEIVPPDRWRTRYIFMASDEDASLEEQDAISEQMETLRDQIVSGAVSFEEAARSQSQAVSASRGGEIPPFREGELFFFYEDAARALAPGEVSPVFRGPRGLYMVQLIEVLPGEEPNLDDPQQAMRVDEALTRQILREAYEWDLRSMIVRQRHPIYRYRNWDLLADCDPVAEVCGFELTKQQLREAFPEIEGDNLNFRPALMETWVRTITEREIMAQEVRALGRDQDEMVQRGRWMAANIVRRDGFVDRLRCSIDVSEAKVRRFWAENPRLFTPLAMKRLIRVTMTALNSAPLPEQIGGELQRVLVEAGGGAPTIPVKAEQAIAYQERSGTVVRDTLIQTEEVFRALEEDTAETTTSMPDGNPGFATDELVMAIEDGPVTSTVMIPGLAPLPAPESITSGSLVELRGGGESEPPSGGGCVPLRINVVPPPAEFDPLPGLVDEEEIPEIVPPRLPAVRPAAAVAKVYTPAGALEPVQTDHANWRSETVLPPADPAACLPLPQGIVAPAINPGLDLQRAPNENKQLKPPPTSNYAYNPDWFFARIDLTVIRDLVKTYLSTDFVLRYDDLGYVYVEDVPDAPARVDAVPVGAFSRPLLVGGNSAVAFYVEDARRVEKPPFEQLKTQAYASYTQVELDKALLAAYKSEMATANITYTLAETVDTSTKSETVVVSEQK